MPAYYPKKEENKFMAKDIHHNKEILVYADWIGLGTTHFMGLLQVDQVRGKEVFSFSYDKKWLELGTALKLDPDLGLYTGPQYIRDTKPNFGLFLDSSPDRWGRTLMERREALNARQESRKPRSLMESDYLLGVFDLYRMGGIRFKLVEDGAFLDENATMAAPPMTSLRTLEETSIQLEKEDAAEDPALFKTLVIISGAIDASQETVETWRNIMNIKPMYWALPGAFGPSNTELLYLKKDLIPLQNDFKKITCNVLFIHGDKDTWVPIQNIAYGKKMMVNAASITADTVFGGDHQIPWNRREDLKKLLLNLY